MHTNPTSRGALPFRKTCLAVHVLGLIRVSDRRLGGFVDGCKIPTAERDYRSTGATAANNSPLPSISSLVRACAPERSDTYRMSEISDGISEGRDGTASTV